MSDPNSGTLLIEQTASEVKRKKLGPHSVTLVASIGEQLLPIVGETKGNAFTDVMTRSYSMVRKVAKGEVVGSLVELKHELDRVCEELLILVDGGDEVLRDSLIGNGARHSLRTAIMVNDHRNDPTTLNTPDMFLAARDAIVCYLRVCESFGVLNESASKFVGFVGGLEGGDEVVSDAIEKEFLERFSERSFVDLIEAEAGAIDDSIYEEGLIANEPGAVSVRVKDVAVSSDLEKSHATKLGDLLVLPEEKVTKQMDPLAKLKFDLTKKIEQRKFFSFPAAFSFTLVGATLSSAFNNSASAFFLGAVVGIMAYLFLLWFLGSKEGESGIDTPYSDFSYGDSFASVRASDS